MSDQKKVQESAKRVVEFFNSREEALGKSEKAERKPLKSNVISYHYTNAEKTLFEIRLDEKTVLAKGEMDDTEKRRGFYLYTGNGNAKIWIRTMADVREFVAQNTDFKAKKFTMPVKK